MKSILAMFALMFSSNITLIEVNATSLSGKCSKYTSGYWENWKGPINPGPGTVRDPSHYENDFAPMSHIFYSFITLAKNPNPWNPPKASWDGKALYESMTRADVMEVLPGAKQNSSHGWQTTKLEAMMKHAKDTGKKWIWAIGGWSDITKTIKPNQIDAFVERCVELLQNSGDGIDFDWEHISEDASIRQSQLETMAHTLLRLRKRLNAAGLKHALIGYTTRFNAFTDDSNRQPGQLAFSTDGEGIEIHRVLAGLGHKMSKIVDFANIMMYDVPPGQLGAPGGFKLEHYKPIFESFGQYFNKDQIVMGFEPGRQAAGGQWEGMKVDQDVTDYIQSEGYGGVMYWAINETGTNSPPTGETVNKLAKYANRKFQCLPSARTTPTTNPVDPVDPTEPADPTEPEDPAEPVDPADPVDPVDPADPVDPVDPETPPITAPVTPPPVCPSAEPAVDPAHPQVHENGKYCAWYVSVSKYNTLQECADMVAKSNPKYFSYAPLNKDCFVCRESQINNLVVWPQATVYKRY